MQSPIHHVAASGGCCPFFRPSLSRSRLRYRRLLPVAAPAEPPVRVVVGKERRVFFVDRFVLELAPFRILLQTAGKGLRRSTRSVFVDVDAILFEHLLWLVFHERSAASAPFLQLNLMEIIEFYSEDD
ncbi:auxin-responsive protein SAUR76-like [Curcuma longa]|uniref:auxin-responsive protein SAUR76-like n=1 Tax=Curcuma longa TaxID=136217 RepID=UPI003D9F99BA